MYNFDQLDFSNAFEITVFLMQDFEIMQLG